MIRLSPLVVLAALGVWLAAAPAWSQAPIPTRPDADKQDTGAGSATGDAVRPILFDPASCIKQPGEPEGPPAGTEPEVAPVPVVWSDFDITGNLVDPPRTVRELLGPVLERHRALTEDARAEITRSAAAFGYHVVGLGTRETPQGIRAHLHLAPMPMVRRVNVDIKQRFFTALVDDEVRRRMRVRAGAYLPWDPKLRACELYEETRRIQDFLRDEGYFDAVATIGEELDGNAVTLEVKVTLGAPYDTAVDKIQIPEAEVLPVDIKEIRDIFRHRRCIVKLVCFTDTSFTRSQHQADVQKVVDLFHARGFPAVRVRSDFDPGMSVDRRTRSVRFTLRIDPRRRIDVVFEGQISVSSEALRKQLTFDRAASADDVEANDSARAIAAYLQSRGYFDARVTWRREAFEAFDRLVYRIDQGRSRAVREVEFVGNHVASSDRLADIVGTKPRRLSSTLFGASTAATSEMLSADIDRLVEYYRKTGYRDARISVSASTNPSGLGSAALTAALLLANRGDDLYVRFNIDEGLPTLLTQIQVELSDKGDALSTPEERELCTQVLRDLAELYKFDGLARQADPNRCIGLATNVNFREDEAATTRDLLKDRLYSRGRPRAEVDYEPVVIAPRRISARYKLTSIQQLKIGKVVIRGNFRTRESIIRGELRLKEGQLLTKDALAEGARRLRNTALFDAVNIAMPNLETASAGEVNAVVEITERYDFFAQLDAEVGGSTYNGAFVRLIPSLKNLFGLGISFDVTGTIGFDAGEAIDRNLVLRQLSLESTLRLPQWLSRPLVPAEWLEFQTELTGFHRRQETPRFGLLRTTGATLAVSRTWDRARICTRRGCAVTVGLHYDFRSREREVDALRPIGADEDESQVPITTRTGSVGATAEWEERVDRAGTLSPLAPEAGFRLEGQVSYASPNLGGSDEFIKVSAAASKYWPIGTNLVLRADLRYDQGFPLGQAALLPEVERFFAGGDSTVRGYNDDRLATEIVQVGVPPLSNISQIRILPAGGNIRMLGSADAQLRIYKLLSTALFFDAGLITNQWGNVTVDDIRPSVGMALLRIVTPFGSFAFERAVPLRPQLGDDPRGRWHISFAARAQF
ncbi:MAG TPA: POTRA domain-containing protein [Kofleriaceae bacterium]|nr:POTRA domain-containing protein [Kofleriaceae bacterium]